MANIRTMARGAIAQVARELAGKSKEAARALPDSKGGETAKQLQTYRTEIYTYFTRANGQTELIYSAENWVRIKLQLETAGPVAIGTSANLEPVLSGRGLLLDTSEEFEANLPKGTRVYIISETINRVSVTIEPIPWLEQISAEATHGYSTIGNRIASAAQLIVDAVGAIRSAAGPATQSNKGTTAAQLPSLAPAPAIHRSRLTRFTVPKRMR
jgi:hypothetical protein